MTRAAQGDTLTLVDAGSATDVNWRGGTGAVVCSVAGSISSAELQMQVGEAWVDVKDTSGNAVTFSGAAFFNVDLPAAPLRINGTVTSATVTIHGI